MFARYGIGATLVAGRGAHFKSKLVDRVSRSIGSQHHLATAHLPRANGTTDTVNRTLLKRLKSLQSQLKIPAKDYWVALPVTQAAL